MTFTISKKDIAYFLVIAVLLVITSASLLAYKARAQESKEKIIKSEGNSIGELVASPNVDYPDDMDMPFASCIADIAYRGEASDTYSTDIAYDPSFFYGSNNPQNGFLDVNGDNLVDYVYSRTSVIDANGPYDGIMNSFTGCVYLNNGNGWTKTYRCYSQTFTDRVTGDIINGTFRGDCAGEPSTQKQSQE